MRGSRYILVSFVLFSACDDVSTECSSGFDCPSGVCTSTGSCEPMDGGQPVEDAGDSTAPDTSTPDSSAPDGSVQDAEPTRDSAVDEALADGSADGPGCVPAGDGTFARSAFTVGPGIAAPFLRAEDVSVSTSGQEWDFSNALAGDEETLVEVIDIDGQWFADSYPDATYAAPILGFEDLLGVYLLTDDALLLVGIVSETGGAVRTELTYTPPLPILRFPLEEGANWQTMSEVRGITPFGPALYSETYSVEVETGVVTVPLATFDAFRINASTEQTVGLVTTTWRNQFYLSECVGFVANLRSQNSESETDFSSAAVISRLGT